MNHFTAMVSIDVEDSGITAAKLQVLNLSRLEKLEVVKLKELSLDRFQSLFANYQEIKQSIHARMSGCNLLGRRIFHINSSSMGGGVAEMLQTLVPYFQDIGFKSFWVVIKGDEPFFKITKNIHNGLHGFDRKSGLLSLTEHAHYSAISEWNSAQLLELIQPGDFCIFHDPQTAGMISRIKKANAFCIWRCHIGADLETNIYLNRAWEFLRRYIIDADALVFSRKQHAPKWICSSKLKVIPPSIDAFSPKNEELDYESQVLQILYQQGILRRPSLDNNPPSSPNSDSKVEAKFTKLDGTIGFISHKAIVLHSGPLPPPDMPMILQVSRWDALKDMPGVIQSFADYVSEEYPEAYLVIAGPEINSVKDDPESASNFKDCVRVWKDLDHFTRGKVSLVLLSMDDVEENAAVVNALQRHATIVCQKSIYEGFGLTVTEAMWKGKAVVASEVGGIQDQILDGFNGKLLQIPTDLETFGHILTSLLRSKSQRDEMGKNAKESVRKEFLAVGHLQRYVDLLCELTEKKHNFKFK